MLSNTFSDFISDVGATEHRHYDQQNKKKIEFLDFQECSSQDMSL